MHNCEGYSTVKNTYPKACCAPRVSNPKAGTNKSSALGSGAQGLHMITEILLFHFNKLHSVLHKLTCLKRYTKAQVSGQEKGRTTAKLITVMLGLNNTCAF